MGPDRVEDFAPMWAPWRDVVPKLHFGAGEVADGGHPSAKPALVTGGTAGVADDSRVDFSSGPVSDGGKTVFSRPD